MCLSMKTCDWKGPSTDEARGIILKSPLCRLRDLIFKHIYSILIPSFVERWLPDTNNFHMRRDDNHPPWCLVNLGKPARGLATEHGLSNEDLANLIIQQIGFVRDLEKCVKKCGIEVNSLTNAADMVKMPDAKARWHFAYLLGSTLFVDRSGGRILTYFCSCLKDIYQFDRIGWGKLGL